MRSKGLAVMQVLDFAKEREPARRMSMCESGQEEPPEQAGQHAHRQQEVGSAVHPVRTIERYPAARHDHMQVWMVGHCRAPAVEHGGGANAGAQVPGIGSDREQRLGRCAEQQVVDHRLVLVGDGRDLGRQREDYMEIADRQQIGLAGGEPVPRRRALTLWAMAVAAGVVGDPAVAAILAALDMAAESSRAALLNGRHRLELAKAHMTGIGLAPGRPVAMEDICDLELWAAHGRRTTLRFSVSLRSAVRAGRAGWSQCGSWCWRRACKGPWCRVWHGRAAPG